MSFSRQWVWRICCGIYRLVYDVGCREAEVMQLKILERETGFEPATSTLARSHSTTELLPLNMTLQLSRSLVFAQDFGSGLGRPLVASS